MKFTSLLSLVLLLSFAPSYCMDTVTKAKPKGKAQKLCPPEEIMPEVGPQIYPPEEIFRINSWGKPVLIKPLDQKTLWLVNKVTGNQTKPASIEQAQKEYYTWTSKQTVEGENKTIWKKQPMKNPATLSDAERLNLTYKEIVQMTTFLYGWFYYLKDQAKELKELKELKQKKQKKDHFNHNNRIKMLAIAEENTTLIHDSKTSTYLKLAKLKVRLDDQIPPEMIKMGEEFLKLLKKASPFKEKNDRALKAAQEKEKENREKGHKSAAEGLQIRKSKVAVWKSLIG